jgi:lipoprotein-releasing system ATP-binding protein
LIEINDLNKTYKTNGSVVQALRGINLEIPKSSAIAVEGVSGSGKSTLLQLIGTLDKPSSGNIKYNGVDIFKKDDEFIAKFRNKEIGFVFQFHYLLNDFNAVENVMIPGLINGLDKQDCYDAACSMLETLGLANRLNHRPGELSGGEQQRVAIARSILLKPSVILADEPTGNLDHKTGSDIIDIFFKLNQEYDITIIVVTHNAYVSSKFNKKIVLLDGQIVNEN